MGEIEFWSIVERRLISFYDYSTIAASDIVDRLRFEAKNKDLCCDPNKIADDVASGKL